MVDNVSAAFELRKKYTRFRILVIGRANAGKTTLLQRVCNSTGQLDELYTSWYEDEPKNFIEPTSERGIHNINQCFSFGSNRQLIFHDSPGFEAGDESQLKEVQSFLENRAKATEVSYQLHAIWFCFDPDMARPLLDLEKRFFNEQRAGNVPVIAIFMKFDDLIKQVYSRKLTMTENRQAALDVLEAKFRTPLSQSNFPPSAYVRLEKMQKDDGNHQDQVKELIKETADSLSDLALKMLFVSVQENNLEICIRYAAD